MSDDFLNIDKAVVSVSTLLGVAVTVAGALWRRAENRASDAEKRISALETEINKKVDYKNHAEAINAIREEIQAYSKDSTLQIIQKFDTLNARMDDIFKLIVNNKH